MLSEKWRPLPIGIGVSIASKTEVLYFLPQPARNILVSNDEDEVKTRLAL